MTVGAIHQGFPANIVVYGTAGSGKTHTLLGLPRNPGVGNYIYRHTQIHTHTHTQIHTHTHTHTSQHAHTQTHTSGFQKLTHPRAHIRVSKHAISDIPEMYPGPQCVAAMLKMLQEDPSRDCLVSKRKKEREKN